MYKLTATKNAQLDNIYEQYDHLEDLKIITAGQELTCTDDEYLALERAGYIVGTTLENPDLSCWTAVKDGGGSGPTPSEGDPLVSASADFDTTTNELSVTFANSASKTAKVTIPTSSTGGGITDVTGADPIKVIPNGTVRKVELGHSSTPTVDFELNTAGDLVAEVNISKDANNALTARKDGLYVSAGSGPGPTPQLDTVTAIDVRYPSDFMALDGIKVLGACCYPIAINWQPPEGQFPAPGAYSIMDIYKADGTTQLGSIGVEILRETGAPYIGMELYVTNTSGYQVHEFIDGLLTDGATVGTTYTDANTPSTNGYSAVSFADIFNLNEKYVIFKSKTGVPENVRLAVAQLAPCFSWNFRHLSYGEVTALDIEMDRTVYESMNPRIQDLLYAMMPTKDVRCSDLAVEISVGGDGGIHLGTLWGTLTKATEDTFLFSGMLDGVSCRGTFQLQSVGNGTSKLYYELRRMDTSATLVGDLMTNTSGVFAYNTAVTYIDSLPYGLARLGD